MRHGTPASRRRRTIAAASAPVVASGFSMRSAFRALATASAIARWRLGGTTAITPADVRVGDQVAPVGVEAAAELARLCRPALDVAATQRGERSSGTSARM